MGLLLDLIRRWFAPKTQPTPRALPSPAVIEDRDPDPDPDPAHDSDSARNFDPTPPLSTAALPWLMPVADSRAVEEPPVDPPVAVVAAPVVAAVAPPADVPPGAADADADARPLGLASDLGSRLGGDWGSVATGLAARDGLDASPLEATAADPADTALPGDPALRAARRAARGAAIAQRRQERAEAGAERRRTEIRFLGRGVSAALNDRQGDRAKLARAGLPPLDSPAELAGRLEISIPRLRWLAFHAEVATRVHYVSFEVAKKGGGTRRLSAPHRSLAQAQRWIWREIVARLPTEDQAHGFIPGRSIVTNALAHSGRAVVVNLDLAGFFPAIGFRRVRAVFERVGYSPAIATILGLLCTEAPRRTVTFEGTTCHVATGPRGLPQGACTSPGLANQVARRLDRRLGGLASKLGATYTRYADDLTFSGGSDLDPRVGPLLALVRRIAASEGFTVNEAKTRVLRPSTAQVVTGLVVNDRPGVARAEVRRLRAILHRARVEGLDAQNRDARPDFRAWLLGKIAFVAMARPDVGARLLAAYRAIESA